MNTMKDKEKDLIIRILKHEIADAEFAVEHCKANGYGELQGQVDRLNDAYCAMILHDNAESSRTAND